MISRKFWIPLFCVVCLAAPRVQAETLPTVLTLEEAHRIALEQSPTLLAAAERIEQARAQLKQALSAYKPGVTSSVTASVTEISDNDKDAAEANVAFQTAIAQAILPPGFPLDDFEVDDTIERYVGNITASYLLFDGFARKFRTSAARTGEERSEAARLDTQRLVLNAVSLAYYNVQLARENVRIARADKEFNERQLKEAKLRRDAGTGSLSDQLNFEVRINAAESVVLQAENARSLALVALLQLIGADQADMPPGMEVAPLDVIAPESVIVPPLDESIQESLLARPDYLEIQAIQKQTSDAVGIAKAQYFPTVSVSASADAVRGDDVFFEEDDTSGTLAIRGQYEIYAGGRRRAMMHEARSIDRESGHLVRATELRVQAEVESARRQLETARQVLKLQQDTTSLVEQNRDLVEKEYDAGQASLVRLNEAQRDLISQQAGLALAQVSLQQAQTDFDTATARILRAVNP